MLQSEVEILDLSFQNCTIFRKGLYSAYLSGLTQTMTYQSKPYTVILMCAFWFQSMGMGLNWGKMRRVSAGWSIPLNIEFFQTEDVTWGWKGKSWVCYHYHPKWERQFLSVSCQDNFGLVNHDKERRKVVESGGAAIIEHHTLGDFQTTEIYFSQFWKLEIKNQSIGRFGIWLGAAS